MDSLQEWLPKTVEMFWKEEELNEDMFWLLPKNSIALKNKPIKIKTHLTLAQFKMFEKKIFDKCF